MKKLLNISTYVFLLLGAGILFVPFLGAVPLFDWDEINFAEIAREMLVTDNYFQPQINFQPFYEKPPLFMWMQVASMKFFGINEFAARFPNAICGILVVLIIYRIGKRLYNRSFGLLWALTYVGSLLPHFYFKSGLIDPWYNLFIFLGIYHLSRVMAVKQGIEEFYENSDIRKWIFYSAFYTGLAVLTKGPVAILVVWSTLFITFMLSKARNGVGYRNALDWTLYMLMTASIWFIYETAVHGTTYVKEFFIYQIRLLSTEDAEHGGPFFYHFIVLLLGCFPASAFLFFSVKDKTYEPSYQNVMRRMMWATLICVLIIFSIVQTKIVHYSSLAYYPISFLAAYNIFYLYKGELKMRWYNYLILLLIGSFWVVLLIGIPYSALHIETLKSFVHDKFMLASLEADVHWENWEMIFGIIYGTCILIAAVFFLFKKNVVAILILFLSSLYITQVTMIYFIPKIEIYTQQALIDFCKSKRSENVYITAIDFKSYAIYFYSDYKLYNNPTATNKTWLMHGDWVEKDIYFICKEIHAEEYKSKVPEMKELYRQNGYVFLYRKKPI